MRLAGREILAVQAGLAPLEPNPYAEEHAAYEQEGHPWDFGAHLARNCAEVGRSYPEEWGYGIGESAHNVGLFLKRSTGGE